MTTVSSLELQMKHCVEVLGLPINAQARKKMLIYQEELLRWNRKVNLTAVCDPLESVEKNLVDSLTLLPFLSDGARLLDMGSGAGLPGIPIALARPDLHVVSLETIAKKVHFQRHAARRLNLLNFRVCQGRIEKPEHILESEQLFDVVVARALTELPRLLKWAAPYLKDAGLLIAMKGPRDGALSETEKGNDSECPHFILRRNHSVVLPLSRARRHLLIYEKQ